MPWLLYHPLRRRPSTHCTRSWAGLRTGLVRCGKISPHRASNPKPSNP